MPSAALPQPRHRNDAGTDQHGHDADGGEQNHSNYRRVNCIPPGAGLLAATAQPKLQQRNRDENGPTKEKESMSNRGNVHVSSLMRR